MIPASIRRLTVLLLGAAVVAGATAAAPDAPAAGNAAGGPGTALVLEINGPIGPATSHYVVHGIESAREYDSRVVVLEMDTPGGLDTS
ncbi:MAG TPA: hypothetical protein VNV37_01420, partial [Solirubrobacteraceae bacterium]|nr:hypothetical protein [Solirubrobacteraceae bacterium]